MFEIIISGLLASTVMILLMNLITKSNLANADMVRAIGSLITKSKENCLGVGLTIYFAAGIVFAFPYYYLLNMVPMEQPNQEIVVAGLLGLVHGFIVSFALVVEVAGRHPVREFSSAGFAIALAHILGHVFYGLTIGISAVAWQGGIGTVLERIDSSPGLLAFTVFAGLVVIGLAVSAALGKSQPSEDGIPEGSRKQL